MLKGVDKPLFRKSIAKPLNESSIIIQEELRIKDIITNDAMSSKSVPEVPVKVVFTTETVLDTDKLEQKDNMHNILKIDIFHKACGVANCMSCAFNVMYAYSLVSFYDRHFNLLEIFALIISSVKGGVGSSRSPSGSNTMGSSLGVGVLLLPRGVPSKSMTWFLLGLFGLDRAFDRERFFCEFLDLSSVSQDLIIYDLLPLKVTDWWPCRSLRGWSSSSVIPPCQ